MKKIAFILMAVVLLAGGMVAVVSSPSFAQGYAYPPPPANIEAQPWVGPSTPWVFYNGDWFLNGVLYYFYGPAYGWAPYYAYPYSYIVRSGDWYAPRWFSWYQGHPTYWQGFLGHYSYWRGHRQGQRYGQAFYNQHNRGQGAGWQRGYHGVSPAAGHNRQSQVRHNASQHNRQQMRGAQQHQMQHQQMHGGQRPQMQHQQMRGAQRPQQHQQMKGGQRPQGKQEKKK